MLAPGSTIGILGGGQLGRMSAIAAAHLGYRVHIYSPVADEPAFQVANEVTVAAYEDHEALRAFCATVDVVTLEFENVPTAALELAARHVPVRPGAKVLAITQHRRKEKDALRALGIATAPFVSVIDESSLRHAVPALGFPCILKTSEEGYDGKGQRMLKTAADVPGAWESLGKRECVLEGFVDFECELSVLVARRADTGDIATYPVVENLHRNHILHKTIAPADVSSAIAEEAEALARRIAEGLELEGLLAVELFLTKNGTLVVNELAPRPHNSGHWTLDACATSQFEQHIRAVCGLPLGDTRPLCRAEMLNLIGEEASAWVGYVQDPLAKLHLYGKREAREGRKMGHVTLLKPQSL